MDFYLDKEMLLIKQDTDNLDDYGRPSPTEEIVFYGHFAYNTFKNSRDDQAKEYKSATARIITKYRNIKEDDLVRYKEHTYTVIQVDRIDFMGEEVFRVWLS